MRGVVPCLPVEIPVSRYLFTTHLLAATAEHWAAPPESHTVFHVGQGSGLAFTEVQFKPLHQTLKLLEDFGVIAFFLTLEFPVGSQKGFVLGYVFRLPFLPVFVLEGVINAFQRIGRCFHRCVVAVVKDVELVGRQQFLKDVLVLLEDILDQHVRFFNQPTDRWLMTAGSKPAIVLEDLDRLGIAEEVTEEPQLADRLVGDAGVDVGRLHCFVDNRPFVSAFKHAAQLAPVIPA